MYVLDLGCDTWIPTLRILGSGWVAPLICLNKKKKKVISSWSLPWRVGLLPNVLYCSLWEVTLTGNFSWPVRCLCSWVSLPFWNFKSVPIFSLLFPSFQASLYVFFLAVLSYALIYGSAQDDPTQYSGPANRLRLICETLTIFFLLLFFLKEVEQMERWVFFCLLHCCATWNFRNNIKSKKDSIILVFANLIGFRRTEIRRKKNRNSGG